MVDVSTKDVTDRTATARATVRLTRKAADELRKTQLKKGDAFAAARLAGIMAAKQTPNLIPLAHTIALGKVAIEFEWRRDLLEITAQARASAKTGVELEAMVAAAFAALTIYDMTKSIDKGIEIEEISLLAKSGGKSGSYRRAPRSADTPGKQ